nr:PREDICTED: uncharacterized protein LOC108223475 isoform X2 [Daucus carota subsp. sativus]
MPLSLSLSLSLFTLVSKFCGELKFCKSFNGEKIAIYIEGYTLRHLHQSKVEKRLDSIENAMKKNYSMQHNEFKKLVGSSSYNPATHVVVGGASLLIGYGLGWRGGRWYANRKFRKEQMKLQGQIKPRRWPLRLLRRPLTRSKSIESAVKTTEESASKTTQALPKNAPITQPSPVIT